MFRFASEILKKKLAAPRPKPIVLRGARQVGKSYLVRMIAAEAGYELVEVNLEKTKISEFENAQHFNISKVIAEIEIVAKRKITQKALLFIDEIQAQPSAVNALRYFYEDTDPYLKVIAAGSLLEVMLEKEKISMPVGRVDYFYLGPMTFDEFLLAIGEVQVLEQIQKLDLESYMIGAAHRRAIDLMRQYYYVGGMPEAVKTFVESQDYEAVRNVQNSIRLTYQDDISKYSQGKERAIADRVYNYVPANLGKAVVYSAISETSSIRVRDAIDILSRANVIYPALNNKASGLPLKACADPAVMKLYYLDVGIYNSATGLTWSDLFKLSDDELLTKGFMAEQFIAQHLVFRKGESELTELYYWQRDEAGSSAEIDFIVAEGGAICPIEVKSGAIGKMRSLWQYVAAKEPKVVLRFDLSERKTLLSKVKQKVLTKNGTVEIQTDMICLPVYAVLKLMAILEEYLAKPRKAKGT